MQTHLNFSRIKPQRMLDFFSGLFLCLTSISAFADIVISGNQNINSATNYNNVTLDMSNGRFTINAGGALTVQNSTINVTLSPTNPFFASLASGNLTLNNNTVNVTVSGILPNPNAQALNYVINIQQGNINLAANKFTSNTPFTVGLLHTGVPLTTGFSITNNTIKNFHGGLYLNNSNNAIVDNNFFSNVSFANIYNSGTLNKLSNNIFLFPGNLNLGDAIDIINSNSTSVVNNLISSSSNYGIFIMGSQNVTIDNNKISDGLSYGIFIQTPSLKNMDKDKHLLGLLPKDKKQNHFLANSNITISNNYIAQNRYGLSGGIMDQLIVINNTFIQRFEESSIRQTWTNNDLLLPFASNVTWMNNFYKEAFTQDVPGDNSNALEFIPFPAHGGVFIP